MSSRYKSRLLTFLSERSLKLKDQAQRRLRQAQLVTLWGAQIVLYPLYAAFQSTRVISRQIGRTAQRVLPRLGAARSPQPPAASPLTPPASDSPVRRTLRSLDLFALPLPVVIPGSCPPPPSPEPLTPKLSAALASQPPEALGVRSPAGKSDGNSPLAAPASAALTRTSPAIQAIACLRGDQRLVLVDQGNGIHDVLTPAQASYLQRRLVLELAKFWQAHKQIQLAQQPVTPLPLPRDRRTMLPAVRLWQRTMAWMQTSPVALSIDLFQESRLPSSLLHSLPAPPSAPQLPRPAVSPHPFPMITAVPAGPPQPWWQRLLVWQRSAEPAADAAPTWLDPDHQGSAQGWQSANQLAQMRQTQIPPARPSLPSPQRQWWTGLWPWGDGHSPQDTQETGAMVPSGSALQPSDQAPPPAYRPSASLLDDIEQYLRHLQSEAAPESPGPEREEVSGHDSARQALLNQALMSQKSVSQALFGQEANSQGVADLASGHSLRGDRRAAPRLGEAPSPLVTTGPADGVQTTWLEAKVTPLGYERHPLETILGWVDRSLLWAETWLIKFLKWVSPSPPQ